MVGERLDASLEIHFHHWDTVSVVLDHSAQNDIGERLELLLFGLYATRVIAITDLVGHALADTLYELASAEDEPDSSIADRADRMRAWAEGSALPNTTDRFERFQVGRLPERGEWRYHLIPHSGRGDWRFIASLRTRFEPTAEPDHFADLRFHWKPKGIGFVLHRADYDAFGPASVFVLLSFLVGQHATDDQFLARLAKTTLCIGVAGSIGTITPKNQIPPALASATTGWHGGIEGG